MVTVALQGAEFFAYHGFYPEEQLLGTRFSVDIEVAFEQQHTLNDDKISNTVNYESLYNIAAEQMRNTRKLIEAVAQSILDGITHQYDYLATASVIIRKANPALGGPVKHSVVTLTFTRAEDAV